MCWLERESTLPRKWAPPCREGGWSHPSLLIRDSLDQHEASEAAWSLSLGSLNTLFLKDFLVILSCLFQLPSSSFVLCAWAHNSHGLCFIKEQYQLCPECHPAQAELVGRRNLETFSAMALGRSPLPISPNKAMPCLWREETQTQSKPALWIGEFSKVDKYVLKPKSLCQGAYVLVQLM